MQTHVFMQENKIYEKLAKAISCVIEQTFILSWVSMQIWIWSPHWGIAKTINFMCDKANIHLILKFDANLNFKPSLKHCVVV